MAEPRANPWLDALRGYVFNKPPQGDYIKLSTNENSMGCSPKVHDSLMELLGEDTRAFHRYPDGPSTLLTTALSEHHGIDANRLICGCGSDEILMLLAQAYASCGDEILHQQYGFVYYQMIALKVGATPIAVPDKDYTADVDGFLNRVTKRTKLIYLANPNNPTGTFLPWSEVLRLHAGLPDDVILVLDDAYAEYCTDVPGYKDGIELAHHAPNVVVTRTFSKIYGLASARVGWGYGPRAIIDVLHRLRPPFNVSAFGQVAAVAALSDQEWIAKACRHNDAMKSWTVDQVETLGYRTIPSIGNFFLMLYPNADEASAGYRGLQDRGIAVRYMPKMGLDCALRISIGTEPEMKRLITELQDMHHA